MCRNTFLAESLLPVVSLAAILVHSNFKVFGNTSSMEAFLPFAQPPAYLEYTRVAEVQSWLQTYSGPVFHSAGERVSVVWKIPVCR